MIALDIDSTQPNYAASVRVGAPYQGLAALLSADFQSTRDVRLQVEHLRAVLSGTAEPEEQSGNAFSIAPGREVCVVEGLYGDPPLLLEVPTVELADLLERWGAHLAKVDGDV